MPDSYTSSQGEVLYKNDRALTSRRVTRKGAYPLARYVLLTESQLYGAVSVTVDGILSYVNEGGALVPAVGGESGEGESAMTADFAVANRPASKETVAGMAHTMLDGLNFDADWEMRL